MNNTGYGMKKNNYTGYKKKKILKWNSKSNLLNFHSADFARKKSDT